MTTSPKGVALVTGASTGIGAVYADRLARRGYDLILVARNRERLDTLAWRLTKETGRTVDVLAADLNDKADLARVEAVLRDDARITLLVNNAGVAVLDPVLDSDIDRVEAMIALNVVAPTRLAYAVAPGFVARGGGAIINIGSVVGVAPDIVGGAYGGTKAYVNAFSRSLHTDLEPQGVRIQAVLPGATATDLWDIAGQPLDRLPSEIVMPVDEMVDAALAGFDQGELFTIPALPDAADWDAYEAARQVLLPNLSRSAAAPRYRVALAKAS